MRPRINLLTLGVSDLDASLAFYRDGMGLPTAGIVGQEFEDGAVVFFDMNEDFKLALFPIKSLSKDAKVALPQPGSGAFAIGHLVNSGPR